MPFLKNNATQTKVTYGLAYVAEKREKENGKKGKENIVEVSWIRLQVVLESLNTFSIYVSSSASCGKKKSYLFCISLGHKSVDDNLSNINSKSVVI